MRTKPNASTSRAQISVITPTFARPKLLPHAYTFFCSQDVDQLEWVVVDDSPEPSEFMQHLADSRVKYIFLGARLSSGEKRNLAIDAAAGEVIVQFDDDDYYSPNYVRTMVDAMNANNGDFVKLSSFFLYNQVYKLYGYWDLMRKNGTHFLWSPKGPPKAITVDRNPHFKDNHLGYGFSYVFKKEVWRKNKFLDMYWNQDTPFIKAAIDSGFKIVLIGDNVGLCLHVLHEKNSSASYPQYVIPGALMPKFFPQLTATYLQVGP